MAEKEKHEDKIIPWSDIDDPAKAIANHWVVELLGPSLLNTTGIKQRLASSVINYAQARISERSIQYQNEINRLLEENEALRIQLVEKKGLV